MTDPSWQLWAISGVLTVAAMAIVLWPLVRRKHGVDATREAYDIAVYKDQLQEVERDLERKLLDPAQAEAARTEIKRRMLAAGSGAGGDPAPAPTTGSRAALIGAVAVLVPAAAVVMYLGLGRPDAPDEPLAGREQRMQAADGERQAGLGEAAVQLAKRLQQTPDDLDGWLLLARSYLSLERFDAAAETYRRAYELSGRRADVGSAYGEALALAADAVITDQAQAVFEGVLATDPSDPKAHYYLAMQKAQQGDLRGAMQGWVDLARISPDGAPWLSILAEHLQRASEESGIDPKSIKPSKRAEDLAAKLGVPAAPAVGQAAEPGPSRADMKAAAQMSDGERRKMVLSMVERLAARLKDNPADKAGWQRLERAYRVLGETAKADDAAAAAAKLP